MTTRDTPPPDAGATAPTDQEIAALRARNAELEAASKREPIEARLGHIGRSIAVVVLITLGVVCLTVSAPALWGRNLLLNTNRYVDTVQPLASDPGVQNAVITRVNQAITSRIDVKALVADSGLPARASILVPPLESAVDSVVDRAVTSFVTSDRFEQLWVAGNRAAHRQIDYILTGDRPKTAGLQVNDSGIVSINLGVVVNRVKNLLVDQGLSIARNIPSVNTSIEIANISNLQKARSTVNTFNTLALWLPWIGLALIAGGIAAGRRRRRLFMISMFSVGGGMIVIGLSVLIARNYYLDAIPPDKLPRSTAESVFDTMVRYLRDGLRLVLLIAILLALAAWLSGPSRSAVATRRAVARIPAWARQRGAEQSWPPAQVSGFVQRYRNELRGATIGLAFIVLILWDNPGWGVVITLAIIAVLLLLVVEALRAGAARARPAG